MDGRTDSFSLLPQNLFILGDFNCHHPFRDSRLPTTVRKYLIGSSLLTSSPSITLTYLLFSIAPPLTSSLLPPLALSCSWEVLQDVGSDHLPIVSTVPLSLVFRPNKRPPSSNFQEARWDDFAVYFDFLCSSAEKYSSLFLSSAAALSTSLTLNAAKYSIPFGCNKRHSKAWWSAEVEALSASRKAFTAAHKSDENCQVYIFASRRASSVSAKAKAEAWQTTCSSLSPKSNPKSVYSILRSAAGSSSSSPNFPNCSSPRESASAFANYLTPHLSVSQPKTKHSRVRG